MKEKMRSTAPIAKHPIRAWRGSRIQLDESARSSDKGPSTRNDVKCLTLRERSRER